MNTEINNPEELLSKGFIGVKCIIGKDDAKHIMNRIVNINDLVEELIDNSQLVTTQEIFENFESVMSKLTNKGRERLLPDVYNRTLKHFDWLKFEIISDKEDMVNALLEANHKTTIKIDKLSKFQTELQKELQYLNK